MVRLLEPLPGDLKQARVVVTVLPETRLPLAQNARLPAAECPEERGETSGRGLTGDDLVDHYRPRTELGRKLIELRRAYIESGGKLMTQDEILAEVRERRGDHDDE